MRTVYVLCVRRTQDSPWQLQLADYHLVAVQEEMADVDRVAPGVECKIVQSKDHQQIIDAAVRALNAPLLSRQEG